MSTEHSRVPLYAEIRSALESEIAGQHVCGDVLPSEGLLAARFGVNRHTVRRALLELVEAGLIERRRGLGSVVVRMPERMRQDGARIPYCIGPHTRFSETLGSQGMAASTRLLGRTRLGADEELAHCLRLKQGEAVARIETLRLVGGIPFCRITHNLALSRVPGLLERYTGGPLHRFLELAYGWRLRRVLSVATAQLPSKEDARDLGIGRSQPLLHVRSVNLRDIDAMPIECAMTRFRSDSMELVISF